MKHMFIGIWITLLLIAGAVIKTDLTPIQWIMLLIATVEMAYGDWFWDGRKKSSKKEKQQPSIDDLVKKLYESTSSDKISRIKWLRSNSELFNFLPTTISDYSSTPVVTLKAAKEWIETHFDNNGYGNPIYGRREK